METSTLTVEGQVTIPADIREQLGLQEGDAVEFVPEGGKVYLRRAEKPIEATFGLFKAKKSATLEDIQRAIAEGWARHGRD